MNDTDDSDQPGPGETAASPLRFLTLEEVAEELATSQAQVYALVRNGDLRALKLGGRGQWRVGRADLEDYITRCYQETEQFIGSHPFVEPDRTGRTRGADSTGDGDGDGDQSGGGGLSEPATTVEPPTDRGDLP